jgi:hypothetical protein
MGIRFVERPHQHQMGKTDDIVRRYVPRAIACPEDAARAAAQVLGGSVGIEPVAAKPVVTGPAAPTMALQMPDEPASGPRKWLRSATSIFSNRTGTNPGIAAAPPRPDAKAQAQPQSQPKGGKKFDAPVPLSEFAKRGKTAGVAVVGGGPSQSTIHHMHTGHGRRDQLSAGERTRILRMLRDEGGRLADEDSSVYIGAAPPRGGGYDIEDSPAPAPVMQPPMHMPPQQLMAPPPQVMQPPPMPPMQMMAPQQAPMQLRPDVPARPALVVGLEQAKLNKRQSGAPGGAPPARRDLPPQAPMTLSPSQAPMTLPATPPRRVTSAVQAQAQAPGRGQPGRRQVPPPFSDEPTRQVDDELLSALRSQQQVRPPGPPPLPPPQGPAFNDEPTRMQNIDARAYDDANAAPNGGGGAYGAPETLPRDRFPANLPTTDPGGYGVDNNFDEATSISSYDGLAAMERVRQQGGSNEERTRAVNIRSDPSISDIDWDLD